MSPDKSSNIRQAAENIESLSGVDGESVDAQWNTMRMNGEVYTAEVIQKRIEEIDANIEGLLYDTDIERSIYLAVLERMRLRQQLGAGDDRANTLMQQDVNILQDLNRRITYWQHEDVAMNELRNGILDYEEYRTEFKLDRSVDDGGVLRDEAKEAEVLAQRDALGKVLPRLTLVRRLMITEYRLSLQPNNQQLRMQVDELLSQLTPAERAMDRSQLAGNLREEIRVILGTPSDDIAQRTLRTPKILALHSDAINRHFDSVLDARQKLVGKTDAQAEASKESLKEEHARLLDYALSFQIRSVANQSRKAALLVREGHFGLPVADPAAEDAMLSARPYGPLLPRDREEMRIERDAHVDALKQYVDYLRGVVLREDKSVALPLVGEVRLDPSLIIEDIMTTHVIPQKLEWAEPIARGSTYLWGVHDTAWGLVGLDFDIREKRTEAILAPIYERLGLPENYSDLSDTEKEKARNSLMVQEKLKSVQTVISNFRREHGQVVEKMQNAVIDLQALIQRKPPEKLALAGPPVLYDVMPDISALRTDEEFAGAYEYIFHQLETQIPGELRTALTVYLAGLQTNLSLNIDVADIETQLGNAWIRETLYALAAIAAEAGGGYLLVRRGMPLAARGAMHLAPHTPAALRASARLGQSTLASGANLAREVVQRGSFAPSSLPPLSMSLRLAGGAGIIAAAYRLRALILRNSRLEPLPELDGILASIELMQTIADRDAHMHKEELDFLHWQLDAYILQVNCKELKAVLYSPKASSLDPSTCDALIQRCIELEKQAEKQKLAFYHAFPLNHKNILRSDPKHKKEDNVAVTLRVINQARQAAQKPSPSLYEYEQQKVQWNELRDQGTPMRQSYGTLDSLHEAYDQLYADIDAILPLDSLSLLP